MKRKSLLFLIIVFICVLLLGLSSCNKEKEASQPFYGGYFKNYSSQGSFSRAELCFELEEGLDVVSYDFENDVYIIAKDYYSEYYNQFRTEDDPNYISTDGDAYLYGFCSASEILVYPAYLNIVSIEGDYAIVVRPFVEDENTTFDEMERRIGLVKFRGEGKGNRTSFEGVYNSTFPQMVFVGDYIAVNGTLDTIPATLYDSFTYTTFYNYKLAATPLEAFKIRSDATHTFQIFDKTLVSIGTSKIYFLRLDGEINSYGYLTMNDVYVPFPEDTDGEYQSLITSQVFYLGNDWFVRTSVFKSTEEFEGYEIYFQLGDTEGSEYEYYGIVRSDRYNAATKEIKSSDWLTTDMVANKYNSDSMRDLTLYNNNQLVITTYSDGKEKVDYSLPVMPTSEFTQDGISLAYFYYFPYDNAPAQYEISFCTLNNSGNDYKLNDLIMPALFVDGYGYQSSDPDYDPLYGNAEIIDYNTGEKKILKEYTYSEYSYETCFINSGVVIVGEANVIDPENPTKLYGAFATDGRQLTEFKYVELSPFYGDYAIGMRDDGGGGVGYYRVDKSGKETLLTDASYFKNGVYVTEISEKVGLNAFDGTVLLAAEYDSINILDNFLTEKGLQETVVLASKGGKSYIFRVS